MNLQEYVKLLRSRWITVAVTILVALAAAATYTFLTTPLYQASTRLFVSTSAGGSVSETYQGNRFSQDRVVSYAELLKGETLARRTIDKLGLDMRPAELQSAIKAKAKLDTVLINVDVLDPSPVQARDIANALSDEFVNMVRELETPEGATTPDSRVVVEQRASIPEKPVVPRTARNMGLGLLVGIALGIALAVARDMLDNTVKKREQLEDLTGTGLVGSIPLDKERRKQPAISFDNDNSAIAEAFRKLRTNLHFLSVDNPPRVLVLTSSVPSEGKSTTTINVALALAEAGNNVVIVDGDLRRPTLHKYLDLVGAVGFSTVLSGATTLNEALQKSRFSGLTVLTSGAVPPNPSELLASQAAKSLLAELRAEFDYVIVDSTPLLAVTDAAILAAGADGVLLMVRSGHTKSEQIGHAVANLESVGAPLLGAVFTMVPASGSAAYSYSYYGESSPRQPAARGKHSSTGQTNPTPHEGD
ncbi:polysaccharide biosynthesis tyrosine autokinase [Mycolicibacterium diernhoferi]|uniref:non-specific protein-tyrosine kinase n=1 Tax=Mycolicibacterium diernhoferi TaxID=1801 RepID=A0A1Q4HCJ3_9MYCO|nr:polysaccharide biosynthesis tyrosine autokinase [Mycolicibacterium diernhoferi]OJZ65253.1 protein tyrosine kinase [Mycolicibacterium diernhoferi]OPE55390.1 protein tyrosine kinase [Mycolicibacterium diernhoferi]PEG52287.1 protein tyrosine kinase [Mycolicibacterium diernhoferi]QYL23743.1 polysaccharide biosynthesis tyrosine autokinase [Mycolicibacterium diernhoferi]